MQSKKEKNAYRNLEMLIYLLSKENSYRPQQVNGRSKLKQKKKLSIETMEMIVKLIQESNPRCFRTKDLLA